MTPSSPLISVIIPTYNRSHYIRAAIDSVLQQTVTDVEIIVVDDGSTDDTRDIVSGYGERVHYIYTRNGGVARARNIGMAHARGQYLTFLDSDDVLYPYMLEVESKLLDRYPEVGMVYAEMSAFDDDGFFERYHLKKYHESAYRDPNLTYGRIFGSRVSLGELGILPQSLADEDPRLLTRAAYSGNIFDWYLLHVGVFQNNMLVRREVIASVGPRNEHVRYYEELDYILRIARRHQVCFLDLPTYKLRYHPGQISTTARSDGRRIWLSKQRALLRVVKRHALNDRSYYATHRQRLDRHLAHLHRAVAVPLIMCDGPGCRQARNAKRARRYLSRCWRYGHPQHLFWILTFAPAALRRFGVRLLELRRTLAFRRASQTEPAEA